MEDRKLLNLLMSEMFNAVTDDSLLQVKFTNAEKTKGDVFEGTTPMDGAEVLVMAEQSRDVLKNRAYTKVVRSMQSVANRKIFQESQTTEDMIFGKAVLWTLDVMNNKFRNIGSLRQSNAPAKEEYRELMPKVSQKKKK